MSLQRFTAGIALLIGGLSAAPASAQYVSDRYANLNAHRPQIPATGLHNPAGAYSAATGTATLNPAATSMLNYYGMQSAGRMAAQPPQRPRFIPNGGRNVGVGASLKPHASTAADPTISPYLNLFREEQEDSLPNYYSFVRPYNQQVETNRAQQRQLQNLQRQVQRTAYQQPASGAMPPTGTRARFGDTGQFYSGWNR